MVKKQKNKTSFFREGGGVFLFLVCLSFFYFRGMHNKEMMYKELLAKRAFLQEQRDLASKEKQELELLIRSYRDPDSLEMVLMKGLGMVPKGQTKVYFKKEE